MNIFKRFIDFFSIDDSVEIAPTITLICTKCHNYYKVKAWDDNTELGNKPRTHCVRCGSRLIDERFL